MVVLGVVLGVVLTAVAALLVSVVAASFGGVWWLGVALAAALCLALPALLERRLTRAFRRLQPGAGSVFFQTLAAVNGLWLALLLSLAPQRARTALEQGGTRLLPMASQAQVERIAALIPRSTGPIATAHASHAPATSSAKLSPALGSAAVPPPTSSAVRPPPDADVEVETPAGKVYRERASSVVVLRTHTAPPRDGVMAKLYDKLGVSYAEGLGSGFVVESTGLIVTNHHVVNGADSVQVTTEDGAHYEDVTVLREEPKHDLALLAIPARGLAVAPLSKAKNVVIGARAIAIGSPLGFEYTLTEGIVSQLRNIDGTRFLQMQTAIAPGSSGGPLFDERGAVIGVSTGTGGASGVSLAVHFGQVADLLAAPRAPRALQRFVAGPRLASMESEGGELSPIDRMNLRERTSLLGHVAIKCAKPLVDDAMVTVKLTGVAASSRIETNLPADARDCMTPMLGLFALQVASTLAENAKPPRALVLTFGNLPREGGATGGLVYRFER